MPAPEALREQQFRLARHVRDPAQPPPPGLEDRRLAVYRDLFFNSLLGLLGGNFPVLHRLLPERQWQALVRDFYRDFRCRTPLFPELAREFLQYLQLRAEAPAPGDPPWLLELAHYEWVELALDIAEDEPDEGIDPGGDLLDGVPAPSPLAWALAYQWPVHTLAPGQVPDAPPAQPTLLLVQRDGAGKVRFHAISPLVFRLLQRLAEAPEQRGRDQLLALAGEAGAPDPQAFLAEGHAMLAQLRDQGVLLGTRLP